MGSRRSVAGARGPARNHWGPETIHECVEKQIQGKPEACVEELRVTLPQSWESHAPWRWDRVYPVWNLHLGITASVTPQTHSIQLLGSLSCWLRQRRHSVSVYPLKPGCFCLNTSSDGELIVSPVLMILAESKSVSHSVCPTLCDTMDYSPPSSSVDGILQATILEWVANPFSRGSSLPRDWIQVSCIAGRFFTIWATCWVSFKEGFSSFTAHDKFLGTLFNMQVPCTHPRRS